jgi:hypothetical protein
MNVEQEKQDVVKTIKSLPTVVEISLEFQAHLLYDVQKFSILSDR